MRPFTKDVGTAVVLLAVCAILYRETGRLNEMSAVFPLSIITVLSVLSGIYLIVSLLQPPSPDKGSEAASWKRAAYAGAGIAVYTALIWVCGLLLASIVMMFGFIVLLGDAGKPGQRLLKAGILSVLLSGIFYLLFKYIFAVPLPSGILFGG